MIVKLDFLTISGPKHDLDRMVDSYLSGYDIHIENALSQLDSKDQLRTFTGIDPYQPYLEKTRQLLSKVNISNDEQESPKHLPTPPPSFEEIQKGVDTHQKQVFTLEDKIQKIKSNLKEVKEQLSLLEPYVDLDYNLHKLHDLHFIRFKFGRFREEDYDKFQKYVNDRLTTFFLPCHSDEHYVWGIAFAPITSASQVEAIYTSMNFLPIDIPDVFDSTPKKAFDSLTKEKETLKESILHYQNQIKENINQDKETLLLWQYRLEILSAQFNIRRQAVITQPKDDLEPRYIICGWMSKKDTKSFLTSIEKDDNVFCIVDTKDDAQLPPTKLYNPGLFKAYEMFIHMYGTPNYHELDPTVLVALTYAFIFGAMFGDVGQGLVLAILGYSLYKIKNLQLGGIISLAGIFSTLFGFLYGSIFGFEDVLKPVWLSPMHAMMKLPVVGSVNIVFVYSICFGMILIILTLLINIIFAIRNHLLGKALFSHHAIAGLIFYLTVLTGLGMVMINQKIIGGAILLTIIILSLIVVIFKEQLSDLIERKKPSLHGESAGMFGVISFFELFEMLLSYFSNTLSFVRIGAFAISHGAMMQVVMMLATNEAGHLNWIVIILGNLFIGGMEALVVGIQVLRLEYYELFSHFYQGDGRPFKSFGKISTH